MSAIADNIARIKSNISLICHKLGRNPQDIIIVGVTKYTTPNGLKEAIAAGLSHIAENKIQEAREKFPALEGYSKKVTRHLIGHLQTNKVKAALPMFDMIQSVDSFRIAEAINREAEKISRIVETLLEVNISQEAQKHGIFPQESLNLLEKIEKMKHIRVLGLMAMAPMTDKKETIRNCFRELKNLFERIKKEFGAAKQVSMQHLSMGMTNDYPIAIEEGSNMVRIGRAIFHREGQAPN